MDHQQQEGATAPPPQRPSCQDSASYDDTASSHANTWHEPERNHDGFTPHYDSFMRIVRR